MSTFTRDEKNNLETLFEMQDGYVLSFSDYSFSIFFREKVEVDINDQKYCSNGTSKAKRLRECWRLEKDYLVGKIIEALIEESQDRVYSNSSNFSIYSKKDVNEESQKLIEKCKEVIKRLLSCQDNLEHLKHISKILDAKYLAEQIKRIENSINEDPTLAIGTAKELIETCCKTILSERGKTVSGTPDISILTKTTLKELKLVPEGINEESRGSDVIKRILQNLGAIGNGLGELRGLYGTGHGKGGKSSGLHTRHAKLAVGAASTLSTFLFDTHEDTKHLIKQKEVE